MNIRKRDKSYIIDWYEPVYPYRRIRQSLGKMNAHLVRKIAVEMQEQYDKKEINPFEKGFKILDWYHNGKRKLMITLEEAVNEFLEDRANYSAERTVHAYKEILTPFMNNLKLADLFLIEITELHCKAFLYKKTIKSTTANTYKRHLKSFFNWCIEKKYLDTNPAAKIPLKKEKPDTFAKMTPYSEIYKLFAAFDAHILYLHSLGQSKSANGLKWFPVAVGLMLFAGLRRKDALTRKFKHLVDGSIQVEAIKGTSSRSIPIIDELQQLMNKYLSPGKPDEYLLPSPVKKGEPIDERQITKQFTFFRRLAGLPDNRTLHGLRHSFVTEMLKRGLNTSEVRVLAGHSSVAVTELYTHLVSEHLRDKMNKR